MKITISFEHTELLDYVCQRLAVKGLRPINDDAIRFEKVPPEKVNPDYDPAEDDEPPAEYEVVVDCEGTSRPDMCPMCERSLVAPAVVAAPAPGEVATSAVPGATRKFNAAGQPVNGETGVPKDGLDEELGESLDPPEPVEEPSSEDPDDPSGGIMGLVAQSRRLEQQLEREKAKRPKQPKMIAGESTKPPTPGTGA